MVVNAKRILVPSIRQRQLQLMYISARESTFQRSVCSIEKISLQAFLHFFQSLCHISLPACCPIRITRVCKRQHSDFICTEDKLRLYKPTIMAHPEASGLEKESNPVAPISPEKDELEGEDQASESETDVESGAGEAQPRVGSPLRPVVTAQDWTGPDDPENPHNWPLWKRVYTTAVVAFVAFAV
jgi:hypothetical protein